jgi:hypothetical protein
MKITVAVPTIAGRSKYLQWALKTCVTQDDDFEILISDNSPGDAREVAELYKDPRIRYVRPPTYLPMSAHWDFVLTQISGDLLTIIGDDDGLMPGCIRRVTEIYQDAGGSIPIQHSMGNYFWPDSPEVASRHVFQFLHQGGWEIKEADSAAFLMGMAQGHLNYIDGPMVYHNFVPMSLLKRLTQGGVFFRRACPDIYSALAVAANTPLFISTQELLTIAGQGARSNGTSVQRGGADQFMAEMGALYRPRYASDYVSRTVQLQSLDSLIEVLEYYQRHELLAAVSQARHIARAISEAVIRMPGPVRNREVREAIAMARRQRITTEVGLLIVGRKLSSTFRRMCKPRLGVQAFAQGRAIRLDSGHVNNVFDAAIEVDRILTEARRHEPLKPHVFAESH